MSKPMRTRILSVNFATLEDIEGISYQVEMLGENFFKIVVEGRKYSYYICGERSYMRIQYPKYKLPLVENDAEEKETKVKFGKY